MLQWIFIPSCPSLRIIDIMNYLERRQWRQSLRPTSAFFIVSYTTRFFSLAILERIKMNWDCEHMYALQFDLWQMRATISQIDPRPAADTKCITYQNNIFHVIPIRSNVFFFSHHLYSIFSYKFFARVCVCSSVFINVFVQCPFDVVCALYFFFIIPFSALWKLQSDTKIEYDLYTRV